VADEVIEISRDWIVSQQRDMSSLMARLLLFDMQGLNWLFSHI